MSITKLKSLYLLVLLTYGILPYGVILFGEVQNIPILTQVLNSGVNSSCLNEIIIRVLVHGSLVCLFISCFSNKDKTIRLPNILRRKLHVPLIFPVALLLFITIPLILLSSPVTHYHDVYTRYSHLTGLSSLFISFALRLYRTLLIIVIYYAFNSKRIYRVLILFLVIFIENYYSKGSRIFTFIVVLEYVLLHHLLIQKIKFGQIIFIGLILISSMTLMEYTRMDSDFELSLPSELGAIIFSAYQICDGGAQNTTSIMPFYYLVSPFLPGRITEISPFYWYTREYWGNSDFPPFTLGPIAESFMYGNYIFIIIYSYLVAIILKFISTVSQKYHYMTLGHFISIFYTLYIVLSFKYSILYPNTDIVKSIIPIFVILSIFKILTFKKI